MFIDTITLTLSAGKGGNGIVAWKREKYIPKGGPYGGDGGNGGDVILEADNNILSLEDYRNKHNIKAGNGKEGGSNNRKGKNGEKLTLKIPVGTIIKDVKTDQILYDFTEPGEKWEICKGGKGGRGNTTFKSSTNQAPNKCTLGTLGESIEVILELKLIADVGLVGMPNAGKSTLMSKITHAKVKIAAYPFTTLRPNLGVVEFDDYSRILVADIPGIIKDANQNKGLGLSFIKHIERTNVLVYLIDISSFDTERPLEDFYMLQQELLLYNKSILEKPFLIALNKIDEENVDEAIDYFIANSKLDKSKIFPISAKTKKGIDTILASIQELAQINGKKFI
jgi:GTPase